MDNTKKLPTVLSLCTGYGGIELGLERVFGSVRVLAHVEIEAFAIANLVNKMETGRMIPAPVWTNLKTFRPRIFRNKVGILTGGYPCQPFSAAGKRKGQKDPRHLWPWIRSAIKVIQPKMCFFENVEGHVSLGLKEVLTDLVKLGYSVENDCGEPTWGLFSAAEVGAPHQRKRVFILAYSERSRPWGCLADSTDRNGGFKQIWRKNAVSTSKSCENKLADSINQGREGVQRPRTHEESPATHGPVTQCSDLWPARPRRPQYEWEEPRVLVDTQKQGLQRSGESYLGNGGECKEDRGKILCGATNSSSHGGLPEREKGDCKIKPQLGRAIDGTQDRVDRLRLLGNGVVPQTAEIAFRILYDRIVNPVKTQPSIQLEMF